ncbi:hypothetical protein ACQZ64_30285, partial [Rhizobium rhizogenes]
MDKNKQGVASNAGEHLGLGRRDFLINAALAGAVLPVASSAWAASPDQSQISTFQAGPGQMKTRKLGTLEVSEMGAGCMSISANYGPPADRAQGINTIRAAHQNGVTFFEWSKKRNCASPPRTVLAPFSAYGSLFKLGPWPL